ncbi:MAG: 2Fe-2S iron-sulfur cluster-binding protein [Betaproteobacteria bacterium]
MSDPVQFTLNGRAVEASAQDSDMTLLEFLHERQDLTGTKFCCGVGMCCACTVITQSAPDAAFDKKFACLTQVSSLQGMRIQTVESLGTQDDLAPLQQAFLENFSFQCGYCAPGFLMAATAMLSQLKATPVSASQLDALIESAVGSHVCRCTGYVRYREAIRKVALPLTR